MRRRVRWPRRRCARRPPTRSWSASLLKVALSGQGEALGTIFPKSSNFDQAALQTFDTARAKQLLDGAGWVAGSDGVRAKGGTRLAFTMLSYPGRPELTQMAVAMQAQLKAVGYDMQVREVQQIAPELQKAEYEASMYSINALITGDPLYFYNISIGDTSTYNYAKHQIPGMEALLAQLRDEPDAAKTADDLAPDSGVGEGGRADPLPRGGTADLRFQEG